MALLLVSFIVLGLAIAGWIWMRLRREDKEKKYEGLSADPNYDFLSLRRRRDLPLPQHIAVHPILHARQRYEEQAPPPFAPVVRPVDPPCAQKAKFKPLDPSIFQRNSLTPLKHIPPPPSKHESPPLTMRVPSSSWALKYTDLELFEAIGQGAFGMVYRAKYRGTVVAVKVLMCEHLSSEAEEEFRSEVAVMSALRHPNIVLFIGAQTSCAPFCIVTELASRGSLWSLLHCDERITGLQRLRMATDAARGLVFLHSAEPIVLHRDLKSANLLVDEGFTVKLSDFGLARVKSCTRTMTGGKGTFQWMAPEVLGNQRYSEKADVYSFAVILWELITRQCPYDEQNQVQVAMSVLNDGYRPRLPPFSEVTGSFGDGVGGIDGGSVVYRQFVRLIQRCWSTAPSARPSMREALSVLERLEERYRQKGEPVVRI